MINIPPIKSSTPVKPEILAEVTKTWRVGQILNATTQQGGDALSKVLIQVGQHTLEAKTPVALQTGQDIKLLVKTSSGQLPILSILSPQVTGKNQSANTGSTTDINQASSKLRQFIAIQQSFSQLQQLSQSLLKLNISQLKLPQSLKTELLNIQNTLNIDSKKITPSQLKNHILNSGVFLESKLLKQFSISPAQLKTSNTLNNDFKFQLLTIKAELDKINLPVTNQHLNPKTLTTQQVNQLKTDIQNIGNKPVEIINRLISTLPRPLIIQLTNILATPSTDTPVSKDLELISQTLLKTTNTAQSTNHNKLIEQLRSRLMLLDLGQQVEQSISKITSLQLQPLSREADGLVLLLFNLIFKDSHEYFDLSFRIQEDDDSSTTDNENWKITLNFNFKTLGQVKSNIHLIDNQVSTVFFTELSSTAEKIQPLLPLLERGFKQAGLEVLSLDVVKGLTTDPKVIDSNINLLDENA